ncbi:hypothetical protein EVAR_21091_1 [Eumeta japonica]|uniref:Uncharacterized protein n=1 Tax=Eumeta variegata TaxID=151549 RepID=A0A4C1V1A3_EUMVA|nr:hypothetical protein EVAR_21091_1 [Eumeta japonica]
MPNFDSIRPVEDSHTHSSTRKEDHFVDRDCSALVQRLESRETLPFPDKVQSDHVILEESTQIFWHTTSTGQRTRELVT